MLSGFSQGRLLSLFSSLLKCRCILEIGTFTGYGSLCLAEGLSAEGRLITLEKNSQYAETARYWFSQSGVQKKIQLLEGNASDLLEKLSEIWDLVYLDADKASNRDYLQRVWPNLRKGGMVFIDNVFARGGIFKPSEEQRNFERAVSRLNEELPSLFADAEVFVLPLRDGLSILRKNS